MFKQEENNIYDVHYIKLYQFFTIFTYILQTDDERDVQNIFLTMYIAVLYFKFIIFILFYYFVH